MLLQCLPRGCRCQGSHRAGSHRTNCSCPRRILQCAAEPALGAVDCCGILQLPNRDCSVFMNPHLLPARPSLSERCHASAELLVVEGQSALHAIDAVRRRDSQAVLCLQGKLPNAADRSRTRLLAHKQTRLLLDTLGCGLSPACDPERLAWSRVLLLAEGDSDGQHALWLILQLFTHYLAPLLCSGHVRVIRAPVARVDESGTENTATHYLWSDAEKRRYLAQNTESRTATISTFKGIASMTANERHQLLVDPATRREQVLGGDD